MKVDFRRLTWENYPSTETPINADNLNRLEEGVAGLYSDVAEIERQLGGGVGEYVTDWLNEHVDPVGSAVVVDDTLSIEGAAADAKKTGDEITSLKEELGDYVEFIDISAYDDYYVTSNGRYTESVNDIHSKVITLNKGDKITLDGYGYSTTVSIFAKREGIEGNYTYKPLVYSIDSNRHEYTYTATENIDIIASFRIKYGGANVVNKLIKYRVEGYIIAAFNDYTDAYYNDATNLFDYTEAKDNTSISSTDGRESVNSNRWTTDYTPVNRDLSDRIVANFYKGIAFYDASKTFISWYSSAEYPILMPENTAFIRMVYEKTVINYADANKAYIAYANNPAIFTAHKKINDDKTSVVPIGYFDISSLPGKTLTESIEIRMKRGFESWKNLLIHTRAKYTGTGQPTIIFRYLYKGSTETYNESVFSSVIYDIGGNGYYNSQCFRVPPAPKNICELLIEINIPSGTTLYLDDFHSEFSNAIRPCYNGTRFNAHQGFIQLCPEDTIAGYEMAAKLGFVYCIAIPKAIATDGVFVCFHDDASIGTKLIDSNGQTLPMEIRNQPINNFTADQISEWFVNPGSSVMAREMYPHEKVPTLEDFFSVCAKTGMHPMLSTHPALTSTQWNQIKTLAEKYGLLKTLNVKFAMDTGSQANAVYSVMGDDIESYIIDVNNVNADGIYYMDQYFATAKTNGKVRLTIELLDNSGVVTDNKIASIIAAGYECAIANVSRWQTSQLKNWMSKGVTEFTIDYFASVGLNW